MSIRYLITCVFCLLCGRVFGWPVIEPVDHAGQLESADFVGVVEVAEINETGKKILLCQDSVAFRELRLSLRVLSCFKGQGAEMLTCSILREPTREELIADGVSEENLRLVLLNMAVDEELHLLPARAQRRDQLLVYLASTEDGFVPLTGYLESSRSLFVIEPSSRAVKGRAALGNAEQPSGILDPKVYEKPKAELNGTTGSD
ncbi:hypothetical protein [Sulfuriroseicoccus oceanibius]|uniref:Uncharacterized protein n=1 Tax=Sulfuriroseicoccus oceanibius TaxID=2707525 RepID=A0A6B3LBB6_9BACT|nr:hypothetical protein [Sulfuriroseicoccus oceanibius]QQL43957.1 hypothetical protein G3M56_008620 [Sulfuriroseicoccus oceanibius]